MFYGDELLTGKLVTGTHHQKPERVVCLSALHQKLI